MAAGLSPAGAFAYSNERRLLDFGGRLHDEIYPV